MYAAEQARCNPPKHNATRQPDTPVAHRRQTHAHMLSNNTKLWLPRADDATAARGLLPSRLQAAGAQHAPSRLQRQHWYHSTITGLLYADRACHFRTHARTRRQPCRDACRHDAATTVTCACMLHACAPCAHDNQTGHHLRNHVKLAPSPCTQPGLKPCLLSMQHSMLHIPHTCSNTCKQVT